MAEGFKLHDLEDIVEQSSARIADEYARIRARAAEDPGTAGDQGEENWAELLRYWLPAGYHVRTKGRILSSSNEASPQVDVVVLSPSYPKGLLTTNLYLAAGVLAAFECKNTLRLGHVAKAVQNGSSVQQLVRNDTSVKHHVVYGLLAHSHSVKAKSPLQSVEDALERADRKHVLDPRDCLDLLCVADLGTWALMRIIFRPESGNPGCEIQSVYMAAPSASMTDGYPVSPLGRFLTGLLRRLGTADSELSAIASYFHNTGLFGTGAGKPRTFAFDELPADLDVVW
jgi:hypothetical protein